MSMKEHGAQTVRYVTFLFEYIYYENSVADLYNCTTDI